MGSPPPSPPTLLAERFRLVIHRDEKEASAYTLTVVKSGTKLEPSHTNEPAGTMRGMGRIDRRSGTMQMLAAVLSGVSGKGTPTNSSTLTIHPPEPPSMETTSSTLVKSNSA
ncbi:MAG: hypothetical protein JWP63_2720 [Candidatus Solibacter sp.]|nr:hypothetical protein [Candidatus Solibacter sp.]